MISIALLAASFGAGLASGVHCTAMCGGVVVAFSGVRPIVAPGELRRRQVALNLGRIAGYAGMGAAAGALGAGLFAASAREWQAMLYLAGSALLVLIGLHLAGLPSPLALLERAGAPLWRRVQPLAARLMALRGTPAAFALGMLWGFLPCGLVYGALAASSASGGALQGAAAMAAFGLGTAPWLVAGGVAAARLRVALRSKFIRLGAGGIVLAAGVWGLAHGAAAERVMALLCQ